MDIHALVMGATDPYTELQPTIEELNKWLVDFSRYASRRKMDKSLKLETIRDVLRRYLPPDPSWRLGV